jgi:hypothetical protein
MAKKSVINIPGKKGVHQSEGVVVWAFVGTRKHKFFLSDQGFASQPVLSDWASGYAVCRLPEKGIYYTTTLKRRVDVAIAGLVNTAEERLAKEARAKGVGASGRDFRSEAFADVLRVLDDVPVINGKMTKHHKEQLAANTKKAVEKIKALRDSRLVVVDESHTDLTNKPRKAKSK